MNIAICDDIREDVDRMVEIMQHTGLFKSADYFLYNTGEALLRAIEEGEYFDIVLLDINMPGIDGIEAGKRLTEMNPHTMLIFVTNYPEYALKAFDCNAFHYILKEESFDKFYDVFSKVKSNYLKKKRSYLVRTGGGATRLMLSDIKYVEYENKHLVFHAVNGVYRERGQIGTLAVKLEDFGYIYVHQGYIVNAKWIKSIKKNSVILTDDTEIMMSTKRRRKIIEKYNSLIKE